MSREERKANVPEDEVDEKVGDFEFSGATSVKKIRQQDGRFTIIAIFDDQTSTTQPTSTGVAPASQVPSAAIDTLARREAITVTSPMSSSSAAQELVLHPKIKAMLEVLAFTEGTGNNYGKVVNGTVISSPRHPELVGKKNVSVTDLSQHPNILVQVNATIKSTAAGRYQFLKRTWDGLGMQDFQPKSQDT